MGVFAIVPNIQKIRLSTSNTFVKYISFVFSITVKLKKNASYKRNNF